MPFKANATLCESVRQEVDGKHTLVGVLVGGIETDASDFFARFDIFATFEGIPQGSHDMHLSLTDPSGFSEKSAYRINIEDPTAPVVLIVNNAPFKTSMSGNFSLNCRLGNEKNWRELATLSVVLLSNTAPEPSES